MTWDAERVLADDNGGIKPVTVFECPTCKAFTRDEAGHQAWHAEITQVFAAIAATLSDR